MKLVFRIDCPNCGWGFPYKNDYINQGFLSCTCGHCDKKFYFKLTVTGVNVDVRKELGDNTCKPISSL